MKHIATPIKDDDTHVLFEIRNESTGKVFFLNAARSFIKNVKNLHLKDYVSKYDDETGCIEVFPPIKMTKAEILKNLDKIKESI